MHLCVGYVLRSKTLTVEDGLHKLTDSAVIMPIKEASIFLNRFLLVIERFRGIISNVKARFCSNHQNSKLRHFAFRRLQLCSKGKYILSSLNGKKKQMDVPLCLLKGRAGLGSQRL